jgi:hypothetical protein
MAWTLGVLAAAFVLGLIFWSGSDSRTASISEATTTGQSDRVSN